MKIFAVGVRLPEHQIRVGQKVPIPIHSNNRNREKIDDQSCDNRD